MTPAGEEILPEQEKSRSPEAAGTSEWIRTPLVVLVWSVWLPLLWMAQLCGALWRILGANRLRRFAALGLLVIVILGMIKAVPLIYGRLAMTYEAAHLARTALGRSDAEIREKLTRTAFTQGYSDVIQQDEAFGVETAYDDSGMLICSISIDLRQRVSCFGLFQIPVRIRTRIVKPVDPETNKPQSWEERLFGE